MYCQPASLILAQAAAAGYEPEWFGVDGMDGILTMKGFDTALAEGVMLLTPFNADSTDERTAAFVTEVPGVCTAKFPTSSPRTPMTAFMPTRRLSKPPALRPT